MKTSRLPGFYNLSRERKLEELAKAAGLKAAELDLSNDEHVLKFQQANHMVENAVGVFGIPLGIALNFIVNDREVLVPMAIEEPSVIAGASFMAKITRQSGGFQASTTPPLMIAQIQLLDLSDLDAAQRKLIDNKKLLLSKIDTVDPLLAKLGGGAKDLEFRQFPETPVGPMLVVHLIMDTRDAMGANVVNTAAERIAPEIEEITGGRVHLRILSNLADQRLARATCEIPPESLAFDNYSGERVRDGIIEAWALAVVDPYRAATHNKGIMNAVDAIMIATGNDWRAVEAGAHAYAARSGSYTSLSTWSLDGEGNLKGALEIPLAVGTVGGATRVHPTAKLCLKLMGVQRASDLAEVTVAVGLAQNLAALRALATEGIQRGHMSLHARQIAIAAGATGEDIDRLANQMVAEGIIHPEHAEKIIREWEEA
jgi:hydroxymethylglutaryl-CoA reductase